MTGLMFVRTMQFTWRDGLGIGIVALTFCCMRRFARIVAQPKLLRYGALALVRSTIQLRAR